MTDKVQKIRKEVEKLHGNPYYMMAVKDVLAIIESLQEEPVKPSVDEAMAEIERKAKLFTEANKGRTSEEILVEMRGEEPVSEDLEDAAKNHAVERYKATRDMVLAEKCKWSFKAGAEWQFERVNEALLSEVLPCFMQGGEADEVVAKLEEVLNKK